jgi:predicted transcriptional regulator
MSIKQEVIKMIKTLPDKVDYDKIMAEIYFRQKVDKSLKQIEQGKTITHEQAIKRISKWIKK